MTVPLAKRHARSGHEINERINACRKRVRRSRSTSGETLREEGCGADGAACEELKGKRGGSLESESESEHESEVTDVHVAKESRFGWLERMLAQEVDRRRRLHARFSVQEEAGRV
ncbi:MAG: hypothetical protein WBP93_07915 [Pyrinomonadaceae bacterium]